MFIISKIVRGRRLMHELEAQEAKEGTIDLSNLGRIRTERRSSPGLLLDEESPEASTSSQAAVVATRRKLTFGPQTYHQHPNRHQSPSSQPSGLPPRPSTSTTTKMQRAASRSASCRIPTKRAASSTARRDRAAPHATRRERVVASASVPVADDSTNATVTPLEMLSSPSHLSPPSFAPRRRESDGSVLSSTSKSAFASSRGTPISSSFNAPRLPKTSSSSSTTTSPRSHRSPSSPSYSSSPRPRSFLPANNRAGRTNHFKAEVQHRHLLTLFAQLMVKTVRQKTESGQSCCSQDASFDSDSKNGMRRTSSMPSVSDDNQVPTIIAPGLRHYDYERKLNKMQKKALRFTWQRLQTRNGGKRVEQVFEEVYDRLVRQLPAIRDMFTTRTFLCAMSRAETASLRDHAKVTVKVIDAIIRNLDTEKSKRTDTGSVLDPRLIGRAHGPLRPYGLTGIFWEKLGETIIDVVLAQEAVRDLPGAGQAWVVLTACLVDQMRAGFEEAKNQTFESKAKASVVLHHATLRLASVDTPEPPASSPVRGNSLCSRGSFEARAGTTAEACGPYPDEPSPRPPSLCPYSGHSLASLDDIPPIDDCESSRRSSPPSAGSKSPARTTTPDLFPLMATACSRTHPHPHAPSPSRSNSSSASSNIIVHI